MNNLGARVYGLGAILMGVAGLLWRDFATGGLPVPDALPGRVALACVVAVLLIAGGVLINWRRLWGAVLLTALSGIGFLLIDLPQLVMHARDFGYWESGAEPFALAMTGLIVVATTARLNPKTAALLVRVGTAGFAGCLLIFGTAHFVYVDYSAPFVPSYIPPSQIFWVYVTGAAAIAAGLALLSGILALLAARMLTVMYVLFQILVHVPRVWAAHGHHFEWTEFIVNLALIGAAWIVADALATRRRGASLA